MIIGLEIHIQLNTKTKLFCSCSSNYHDPPNTNVCPICLGLPGSRPMLNKEALKKAIFVARLLRCKINRKFFFSRKIYFYPDLPKNFQITQYEIPIGENGEYLGIRIKRVHLEEDPARIIYPSGMEKSKYCLIDYNRSGIPLVEIVTYPDFDSVEKVEKFLRNLIKELEYFGIFDPKRNTWRADLNVSLEMGYRVEIKNVSGFKEVVKAIIAEIARQKMLKKLGKEIKRETRIWDEYSRRTIPVRKKELEEEYGYILEPDLPFFEVGDEILEEIEKTLEKRPENMIRKICEKYNLPKEVAESVVYNKLIKVFERTVEILGDAKSAGIWVGNYLVKSMNYLNKSVEEINLERFFELMKLLKEGKVNERFVKEAIKWISEGKDFEIKVYDVKEEVKKYFEEHPEMLEKIKENKKMINFVVGEILKRTNYSLDPKEIIKEIQKFL